MMAGTTGMAGQAATTETPAGVSEAIGALAAAWADVAAAVLADRPRRFLTTMCEALAAVTPPWEDLDAAPLHERIHRRLLIGPGFDAWLLAWPQGGSTELHDHGGASGGFSVVAGTLQELSAGAGRPGRTCWRAGGRAAAFGPAWVHDMVNEDAALATSVHVYRPAITSMTYYEGWGSELRPVRVERVDDVAELTLGRAA